MKKLLGIFLLATSLMACDDSIDEIIDDITGDGESSASVSGNVTLDFNGTAEFIHSSIEAQNASTMTLTLTNGNDVEVLDFLVGDLTQGNGLEETTYNYDSDPEAAVVFSPKFITEDDIYLVDETANEVNKITFTSIELLKIKGNFELNLTNLDLEKVKITGTFEATGETIKL